MSQEHIQNLTYHLETVAESGPGTQIIYKVSTNLLNFCQLTLLLVSASHCDPRATGFDQNSGNGCSQSAQATTVTHTATHVELSHF